jgi:hypothetical protein
MRQPLLALFLGTLILGPAAHAAPMPAPASTPAQAAALVRGVTMDFFDGTTHQYEYFAPDGTSVSRDASGVPVQGRWFARPDATVCFMHADPHQSGCVHVARNEGTIQFHRIDGLVEGPFAYEAGNPHGL